MYSYIDETGNTGSNIFDSNQPDFVTAALITKTNFDILHKKNIRKLAQRVDSTELHGNDYGIGRIEEIADGLLWIFKKSDARFFVARAEKKYIAVSKLFDTLFDSFENKAVPWHVYNMRHMRLLTLFKLSSVLREDVVKLFWQAIIEKNKDKSEILFIDSLKILQEDIKEIPDKRANEIVTNAVNWALENPESIYIHTNSKSARAGHLPNMAVFPNLLQGIDLFSKKWNRKVKEIIHDQQSQFEKILTEWHDMYSKAAAGVINWPMEEPISFRRVTGSKFIIKSSKDSPGIQAIDVVLWLFKKVLQGKSLPPNSAKLMNHVFKYGYQNDLSFEGVGSGLNEMVEALNNKVFDEKDFKNARELLELSENRRQEEMKKYRNNKKII